MTERHIDEADPGRWLLLPWTVGASVLILTALLWTTLYRSESRWIDSATRREAQATQREAEALAALLQVKVESQLEAVQRMGERWVATRGASKAGWRHDARRYRQDMPELVSIGWIDEEGVARWIEPETDADRAPALPTSLEPQREARRRAREGGAVAVTRMPTDRPRPSLIDVFYPLDMRGEHRGFIHAAFDLDHWIERALGTAPRDYDVLVQDGTVDLFARTLLAEPAGADVATGTAPLTVGGASWTLTARPNERFVAPPFESHFAIAAGSVLAVVLGLLAQAVLSSWKRGRALEHARQRLELAIDGTNEGLWDWTDVSADAQWWSPNFFRLLEYGPSDLQPARSTFEALVHPDDRDVYDGGMRAALADDDVPLDLEIRLRTSVVEDRWFRIRAMVLRDADGRPHRMAGSIQDIHDRIRAETAVRLSEDRYRIAAETLSNVIWIADPDGGFLEPQRSWERYTGQPWEVHRALGWITAISQETRDEFLAMWMEARREGRPFRANVQCWCARHGAHRWVEIMARPHRDLEGTIDEWVGMMTDIDDRVVAEDALRASELALRDNQEKLREKNDELEQFVFTASHDLKSPLVTIVGYANHLQRSVETGHMDDLPDFAGRIIRAAEHMRHKIDDLLELSRIGRVAECGRMVALAPILESIEADVEASLREHAARIVTSFAEPAVFGDSVRIEQALLNLVENALRYGCPEPGARVEVGSTAVDGATRVWVRDHGPGVPEAYRERIFGLFQRLSNDKQSTGVGLAIVRRVAEVHGGRAGVDSTEGDGSTFWISFPCAAPAPVAV